MAEGHEEYGFVRRETVHVLSWPMPGPGVWRFTCGRSAPVRIGLGSRIARRSAIESAGRIGTAEVDIREGPIVRLGSTRRACEQGAAGRQAEGTGSLPTVSAHAPRTQKGRAWPMTLSAAA